MSTSDKKHTILQRPAAAAYNTCLCPVPCRARAQPSMELHSCLTQVWTLEGLHSPMLAPCFPQSYTALQPRPHLLKLVDLADEEVPIASSDLCVCNMDHVLGKEQDEIGKRNVPIAGRQQELPNLRSFTPASHVSELCLSHSTHSVLPGLPSLIRSPGMGPQVHVLFTSHILTHSVCFCLPCSSLTVPAPTDASLFQSCFMP